MKKVLIAFYSLEGDTEKMAEYVAEGVRFTGNQVETRNINTLKTFEDLNGYDGYLFGSPTYSLDLPEDMRSFLSILDQSYLKGKLMGAFGVYKHEVGYAPGGAAASIIFQKLQDKYQMEPFDLGPLQLKEDLVDNVEGLRACQAYGKAFGEKLGNGDSINQPR